MEGRAGMAGIVLRDGEDVNEFLKSIAQRLTANLASYAVPLFIRLCKTVDRTGSSQHFYRKGSRERRGNRLGILERILF